MTKDSVRLEVALSIVKNTTTNLYFDDFLMHYIGAASHILFVDNVTCK
jgi:hypothetical protein